MDWARGIPSALGSNRAALATSPITLEAMAQVFELKGGAAVTPRAGGRSELWGLILKRRPEFFVAALAVSASVPAAVLLVKLALRHHPSLGEGAGSAIEHGGERAADALGQRAVREVWTLKHP